MWRAFPAFASALLVAVLAGLGPGSAPRTETALRPLTDSAATDPGLAVPAQSQPDRRPFDVMMDVLTHPRCVNCHPAGDQPRVADGSATHRFGVQRGPDGHGVPALRCAACHQVENNADSGVPGAPEWSLAPRSMSWEGRSRSDIARSILDRTRNGGRTLPEVVEHLTQHELVLWAWEPGMRQDGTPREPPPVPLDRYIEAVEAWAAAGAPIPDEGDIAP